MVKKKEKVIITSTPERSLVKACTWEIIAFIITLFAVYVFYGDIELSLKFTLVLTAIKIIFLYIHERAWKKTTWGKVKYDKKTPSI